MREIRLFIRVGWTPGIELLTKPRNRTQLASCIRDVLDAALSGKIKLALVFRSLECDVLERADTYLSEMLVKVDRGVKARTILLAFGLVLALLAVSVTAFLFLRVTERTRQAAQSHVSELASNLATDIDREIEHHITVLNTLSTLPSLVNEDWAAFYDQASTALRGDGYIVLIDAQLRQIVNTFVPFGKAPELTGDPETAYRVIRSKKPEVSDSFVSLVTHTPVFNINIPIIADGEVTHILIYGRKTDYLLKFVTADDGRRIAIADRKGVMMAGTRNSDEPLTDGVKLQSPTNNGSVYAAETKSSLSGWTMRVETPETLIALPLQMDFAIAALVTSIGLAVAIAGALFGARFLTRDLETAAVAAQALSEGRAVQPQSSFIHEIDIVVSTIERVSRLLAERDRQADTLRRELHHRVKNVVAVVHALVERTARNAASAEEVRIALGGRLKALGDAQDLLITNEAKKASLKTLIQKELSAFSDSVLVKGTDVLVDGNRLQPFALLIHELGTNATKYGALRSNDGRVVVSLGYYTNGKGKARLSIKWEEHGPYLEPSGRIGFGTFLLQSAFADTSTVWKREFLPSGLLCELEVCAETFGATPQSEGSSPLISHPHPATRTSYAASLQEEDV